MAKTINEEFDEKFVKTWVEAAKIGAGSAWIAKEMRITPRYVLNKAETLRKHGVKLPSLKSGQYSITAPHVKNLNRIVEDEAA